MSRSVPVASHTCTTHDPDCFRCDLSRDESGRTDERVCITATCRVVTYRTVLPEFAECPKCGYIAPEPPEKDERDA